MLSIMLVALFNLTKVALPKIKVTKSNSYRVTNRGNIPEKLTNLSETEELKDLLYSWWDLVDTSDSDDKGEFWFTIDVGVTVSLGLSLAGDQKSFLVFVFLGIGSGSLELGLIIRIPGIFMVSYLDDSTSLDDISLLGVLLGKSSLGQSGLVSNSLLLQSFWNWWCHFEGYERPISYLKILPIRFSITRNVRNVVGLSDNP